MLKPNASLASMPKILPPGQTFCLSFGLLKPISASNFRPLLTGVWPAYQLDCGVPQSSSLKKDVLGEGLQKPALGTTNVAKNIWAAEG